MKTKEIIPTVFIASSICHTITKGNFSLLVATVTGISSFIKIAYDYSNKYIDNAISMVESLKKNEW